MTVSSNRGSTNRLSRTILRWGLGIYLFYLAVCLFILLPALNIMAPRLAKEFANRELRSEIILFNPFTLALQLRDVSVQEADGHQPLAFELFEANLSLASIWQPGVVLDAFIIRGLDIDVLRYDDGRFHFHDLIDADSPAPEEPAAELPAVTIAKVAIEAHRLHFTDETKPGPFSTTQSDLALYTRNLTTVPDRKGDGSLELVSDGGGLLRWAGVLDIHGGNSQGQLTLENIDLTHGWRYGADSVNFVLGSARLDLQLDYSANWSDELQLLLTDSELRLHAIDVLPVDAEQLPDTGVALGNLHVAGISLNLLEQQLAVGEASIDGLQVRGFDRGDDISLITLFAPPGAAADAPGDPSTEPAVDSAADETADDWQFSLAQFNLGGSEIEWRSAYFEPELMRITPLRLHAESLRWPAQAPSPYSLALTINARSNLTIDGAIDIGQGQGNVNVDLSGLQLPWFNPLVTAKARTDISGGALSVQSRVALEDFAPKTVELELQLAELATELHATGQEAFTLRGLKVESAVIDLPEQTVQVAGISLDRPVGSLHILEDGSINVNGIVRSTPGGGETDTSDSGASEQQEAPLPWRVALSHFALREGQLDFADDSLPLAFRTVIGDIRADIRDLDSASDSPLTLDFDGSVDGYAPVKITGSGRPLAARRDGTLELSFRGMDIASMSPYSGTYAGYAIDSGTLSLDLRYALDGQALDGNNRIVISQMALGEKIPSDRAFDLPLKLGLALLTDSKGVIDLSVPVSGAVDDPSFSLGSVIGTAIKNIIVKAVTAPFSLLAGLVGTDDDLENIAFEPGQSSLNGAAAGTLKTLSEALQQRPQLTLIIAGGSDADADARALREAALRKALLDAGLESEALDSRGPDFAAEVEARYALAFSVAADPEADDGAPPPTLEEQWEALIEVTALDPGQLRDLATARAATAKRELVTVDGIAAERISIRYDADLATAGVQMRVDG